MTSMACARALTLVVILAAVACISAASDGGRLPLLSIDTEAVTVSGLGGGAFMAVQFHVAFSHLVRGVGAFAGGPYYCARDKSTFSLINDCLLAATIDVQSLIESTDTFARQGLIDKPTNMSGSYVYVYHGALDSVMPGAVSQALTDFYRVGFNLNVTTQFGTPSEHCVPTVPIAGQTLHPCQFLGAPFVNRCSLDGVGDMFRKVYADHDLLPPTSPNNNNIFIFDQGYYAKTPTVHGLAAQGYYYVPTPCIDGKTKCRLHVAFHGCGQSSAQVATSFIVDTSYNRWAEANRIVILYPQAAPTADENPQACFDFWGFTGPDYAFRTGIHMNATAGMLSDLIGERVNKVDDDDVLLTALDDSTTVYSREREAGDAPPASSSSSSTTSSSSPSPPPSPEETNQQRPPASRRRQRVRRNRYLRSERRP